MITYGEHIEDTDEGRLRRQLYFHDQGFVAARESDAVLRSDPAVRPQSTADAMLRLNKLSIGSGFTGE